MKINTLVSATITLFIYKISFSQPGTLDVSFGNSGITTTSFGNFWFSEANASAIQNDGKIIISGLTNDPNTDQGFIAACRYNNNGSIDNTYGSNGKVIFEPVVGYNNYGKCMALQADGKMIVGGHATDTNMTSPFPGRIFITRFLTNGAVDTTFGTGGTFSTNLFSNSFEDITLQDIFIGTDGKIWGTGGVNTDTSLGTGEIFIIKLDSTGNLDNTFNSSGIMFSNYGLEWGGTSIIIQPNGKVVIGGVTDNVSFNCMLLIRYNANGVIDSSFANNGLFYLCNGTSSGIFSIAQQSDNKIVACGFSFPIGFMVLRIDTNGVLDNTFGSGGITRTTIGANFDDIAYKIIIQPDNKILVGGTSNSDFALACYNANGFLDHLNFGTSGIVKTDIRNQSIDEGLTMCIQSDAKIIIAGWSLDTVSYSQDFAIARYNNSLYSSIPYSVANTDDITVYPNPTKDILQIKSTKNIKSVIIKSMEGKLIESIDGPLPSKSISFDTYPLGLYFVEIICESSSSVHKVIVSK